MREIVGELFDQDSDYIAITTNGTVKRDGTCVMGRGCALEAKNRWPDIAVMLGKLIHAHGNHVFPISRRDGYMVLSFPVKHNWYEQADLKLIEQSCKEIVELVGPDETCVIPRPGCGNGRLQWNDVKPILERYLDDRFTVISK